LEGNHAPTKRYCLAQDLMARLIWGSESEEQRDVKAVNKRVFINICWMISQKRTFLALQMFLASIILLILNKAIDNTISKMVAQAKASVRIMIKQLCTHCEIS
jgi:hypothetical protein